MSYLIKVWFKPWVELSVVDQVTMAAEVVVAFFLFVFFKVYVIDSLKRRKSTNQL